MRPAASRRIPGALKVFSFKDGQLANRASIAPNGGYGFGPRHLDFHPNLPFVYVSRERENRLNVYRLAGGTLDPQAIFEKDTLAEPGNIRSRQAASTVHVHPNGRYVYVGNRAFDTVDFEGKKIFPGGENNIAVFAIDQATGEPTLIQHEDVRGIYPRTFALDPSGRMLVVANIQPMLVREGAGLKTVPAKSCDLPCRPRRQTWLRAQLRGRYRRQFAVLERHGRAGVAGHFARYREYRCRGGRQPIHRSRLLGGPAAVDREVGAGDLRGVIAA